MAATPNLNPNLSDIKVGDKVLVVDTYKHETIYEVVGLTKTQIEVRLNPRRTKKYLRSNGNVVEGYRVTFAHIEGIVIE